MARAYVGLGANLGDREATLLRAVALLGDGDDVEVVRVSSFRDTEPIGLVEQPRFLNGAVELETHLTPRELLDRLLKVEARLGRRRDGSRFGPRTIDLDLLLYGQEQVAEPGLIVPHPRLHERRFALEPLVELDPGLAVRGGETVQGLLARLQ